MTKSREYKPVWVSNTVFEELLQISDSLMEKDGKTRNPNDIIEELVNFWKGYKKKAHEIHTISKHI